MYLKPRATRKEQDRQQRQRDRDRAEEESSDQHSLRGRDPQPHRRDRRRRRRRRRAPSSSSSTAEELETLTTSGLAGIGLISLQEHERHRRDREDSIENSAAEVSASSAGEGGVPALTVARRFRAHQLGPDGKTFLGSVLPPIGDYDDYSSPYPFPSSSSSSSSSSSTATPPRSMSRSVAAAAALAAAAQPRAGGVAASLRRRRRAFRRYASALERAEVDEALEAFEKIRCELSFSARRQQRGEARRAVFVGSALGADDDDEGVCGGRCSGNCDMEQEEMLSLKPAATTAICADVMRGRDGTTVAEEESALSGALFFPWAAIRMWSVHEKRINIRLSEYLSRDGQTISLQTDHAMVLAMSMMTNCHILWLCSGFTCSGPIYLSPVTFVFLFLPPPSPSSLVPFLPSLPFVM